MTQIRQIYTDFIISDYPSHPCHQCAIVLFEGAITKERIASILDKIESETNIIPHLRKKVYSISVELLQNVYHHAEWLTGAVFSINKENECYKIIACNYLKKVEVPALKKKLDALNSLAPEEMDILYKKTLLDGELTEKGGAGLGLIDIARLASKPFQYDFAHVDGTSSFFMLCVKVWERLN